jgi:hypothetical protein
MIAIIKMRTYTKVTVKNRLIDGTGYVRIVAEDGTIYETHLSNVCFIDEGNSYGKE